MHSDSLRYGEGRPFSSRLATDAEKLSDEAGRTEGPPLRSHSPLEEPSLGTSESLTTRILSEPLATPAAELQIAATARELALGTFLPMLLQSLRSHSRPTAHPERSVRRRRLLRGRT